MANRSYNSVFQGELMSDDNPMLILTTAGSPEEAELLARTFVDERLAACVNLVDAVRSIYRWNDAVQDDREVLLVIKTMRSRIDDLRDRLHAIHSYEVPEFVVVPIAEVSEAYGVWLKSATREQ